MSVLTATRVALTEAGRLDSALGQAAMNLARRLSSRDTPASAAAAIGRELRLTLSAALEHSQGVADPIDELRERRERRHHRGA